MINFLLLVSRQGKTRLTKWYESYAAKEKARIVREITATVLARAPKMCNFVEWRNKKIIYKRYASLFFIVCVDSEDNELIKNLGKLLVEVLKAKTVVKTAAAAGAAAAAAYQITRYSNEGGSTYNDMMIDAPQLQDIAKDVLEHLAN